IEASHITLDIRDTDGNVYITLVSAIEPLERLSIQSDVSSIAMAQDNFVDISVPEISGGYEPYTVSLLPTYVIAAPYISVERLASGDFRISGLREGVSTARFVLSDASGKYLSGAEIDVVVVNSPPTIQPISDVNASLDESLSIMPESTGLGIEWSYSGSLPSGVILNTQTGELSGTPSVIGTFPVTLIATNPVGAVSTPFTLSVNPQFIGTVSGVDLDLPALSGIAAQQWQIVDGDLPSGLTLNSETGVISGTATEGGDFHLVISADGNEIEFTLSVLVVVVNQAPTISVSMPDYLKAGIQTVINFEASDPDGDLLDITAEVVAGADLVTIAEITETQISLDVVASATHGDEIILAVTATDPSGAAAGQLISTRTEHLIYPEGMINPSMNVSVDIPVEGAFNVVDIGDACIAYYRYVFAAVSGGGYAYGGHYFFDKATSNWG
ncbi:MAG: putative Ig domain-containing protein, partial [Thalassolituus sp.]